MTDPEDSAPRRVLVVDDEASIRSFLVSTLDDEGYEVREAEHGRAALDLLATWTPHAILLDLYMPTMDGWAFRQEQRRLNRAPHAALILMTASRAIDEAAAALGAAHHVSKPFDLDDLFDLLAESVASGGGSC